MVWWLSLVYGALLLWALSKVSDSQIAKILGDYISYLPLFIAAAWALGMATLKGRSVQSGTRRSLGLLTGTMILWLMGNAAFTWTFEVQQATVTAFSIGDGFFILGDVFMIMALLTVPRRSPGRYPSLHAILDLSIVLAGASVLFWDLIVRPTLGSPDSTAVMLSRIVYPILAVGYLMSANWIRNSGGTSEGRATWRIIYWAVTAYAVSEGFYQLIDLTASAPEWYYAVSELLYVGAYLAFQAAGYRYLTPDHSRSSKQPWRSNSLTPLPLAVAAGVVILLVLRLDGSLVWEHWPIVGAVVVIAVLIITRQEVTARENDRLIRSTADRKSEERTAALIRHSSDLVILTDSARIISFASPSSSRLLGVDPDDLTGRPLSLLLDPGDSAKLDQALTTSDSRKASVMVRLGGPGGESRDFEVMANDLTGEPAVEGIVLVGRDLSERRQLEDRLRQAEKLEAVGKLAGGIAHDFNNILTTIMAETELMIAANSGSEELNTVREAAEMGASLTRQLLTFARRQVPASRPSDLNELVGSTLRMMGKLRTDIRVDYRPAGAPCNATLDPQQIRQVILNLLINARDAMPMGGTLTVTVTRISYDQAPIGSLLPVAAGEHVVVSVGDTGIGMDREVLQRAFEPFFTTKSLGHGTGLGLPSVLGTLQQHDAGLWVESTPGTGTRIAFSLPVAAESTKLQGEYRLGGLPSGSGMILVVDDEDSVRDVTRRLLERLGYTVRVAGSPALAGELLATDWRPDLIITDVVMPGESGPQFVARLRQEFPGLKVLFFSGYTGTELRESGDLDRDTAFLAKPFTQSELANMVHELLDTATPAEPGTGEIRGMVPI